MESELDERGTHGHLRHTVQDVLNRYVQRRWSWALSHAQPHRGLKNLPKKAQGELDLNNELIDLTAELCLELHYSGGAFVIENPVDRGDPTGLARRFYNKDRFPRCDEHGPLWLHPAIKRLIRKTGALFVMFDQCVLGSKFMKSTCLLVSPVLYPRLRHLWGCRCVCTELHEDVAIGKDRNGNFNSARAAAYPEAMNQLYVFDVACEFFLGELGTVEEAKEKAEAYGRDEAADAVSHAAAEDEACRAFGRLDAEQHACVRSFGPRGALALGSGGIRADACSSNARARHLVERVGLAAADVLCFSFARDAAMELRQRVAILATPPAGRGNDVPRMVLPQVAQGKCARRNLQALANDSKRGAASIAGV